MSDQSHLDDDVAAVSNVLTDLENELSALKSSHPDVDLAGLDALVAKAKAADQAAQVVAPANAAGNPANEAPAINSPSDAAPPVVTETPVAPDETAPANEAPADQTGSTGIPEPHDAPADPADAPADAPADQSAEPAK